MKAKVYLETTIASYLTARESPLPAVAIRQGVTREWWENRRSRFDLVVSEIVMREAEDGDMDASSRRLQAVEGIPILELTEGARSLAKALVSEGAVPAERFEDALHISVAAVNGVDYLLTWNCKHIANATLRHEIERVIEEHGYECPVICTPEELMEE